MSEIEVIARLLLALACSAVIGYERESAQKAAGFRTHILVGVGAAIFTIVSIIGFEGGDESRVAAQIVTGVGFLGAGAIFKEGATVRGLTTAAGLWVVAAVGMAAGSGSYTVAITGTVIVVAVLILFYRADAILARRKQKVSYQVEVTLDDTKRLDGVLKFAGRIDDSVEQVAFRRTGDKTGVLIIGVREEKAEMVAEMLSSLKGVSSAEKLSPLFWVH